MELRVPFCEEDFFRCFEFAVKYHLASNKSNFNRTTGQYRGLGSIINDFFYGKLIEIGTAKALENFNPSIKINLDFEIHELTANDPDIISILEKDDDRPPRLFAEIKNVSSGDRWVGLTQEQLRTIRTNEMTRSDCSNVFLIYALIKCADETKNDDLLGIFLKNKIKLDKLDQFCDIGEISMEFPYILTGAELLAYGTEFNEGSYFYETDIASESFSESGKKSVMASDYKCISGSNGIFPVIMENLMDPPSEFGEFHCDGSYHLFIKENVKSNRIYLYCDTNLVLKNRVLGVFEFKAGDMHQLFFNTIGRNPKLKRNNLWVAQRNLINILSESTEDRLKKIAYSI